VKALVRDREHVQGGVDTVHVHRALALYTYGEGEGREAWRPWLLCMLSAHGGGSRPGRVDVAWSARLLGREAACALAES
jgi:hypothetical protein